MSPEARAALQRRLAEVAATKPAVSTKQVVHVPQTVVHEEPKQAVSVVHAVVHTSRHGVYADLEARKAYRRKWAKENRAKKRAAE